jgi:hypothetical protein
VQRDASTQEVRRIEFRYLNMPAELPRARRMSFFLTTAQVLAGTKTVTRRTASTWSTLKPGHRLIAIDVRLEKLGDITAEDCAREGFPEYSPAEFVAFFARAGKGRRGGADARA